MCSEHCDVCRPELTCASAWSPFAGPESVVAYLVPRQNYSWLDDALIEQGNSVSIGGRDKSLWICITQDANVQRPGIESVRPSRWRGADALRAGDDQLAVMAYATPHPAMNLSMALSSCSPVVRTIGPSRCISVRTVTSRPRTDAPKWTLPLPHPDAHAAYVEVGGLAVEAGQV
jgi:hypothetical protein